MEVVLAISINPQSQAQVTPQDLTNGAAGSLPPNAGATPSADQSDGAGDVPQSDQIAAHAGLVAQASQSMQAIGSHPDLDGDSARLLALQVSQQLGSQSQSIANQAPQALLSLLR
jgi:flagellin